MEQITYRQRECADNTKISRFLEEQRVGTLGLHSKEYPYAVPVNYVWADGCIYFHGSGGGKKVCLLAQNPNVVFTVYQEHGTVTDPVPCHADTAYFSVMLFGQAERVVDFTEAAGVLQKLLERFMPGFYQQKIGPALVEKYRSGVDSLPVTVYRIRPAQITAKENNADPGQLFGHGPHKNHRS
ncbi:MAG: pyridoxamine 5'-phosphate oxidase family protein [Ethanoligenens sp.]|uniref:pyridoxamine 5'-phosphate oxidase family protein n=1 Tax=Ethanoligenens sp. TaxID=2099655 RepID=UPI0039EB8D6B